MQELQFRLEEKDKEVEKMRQELSAAMRSKEQVLEQVKNIHGQERQVIKEEL